MDSNRFPPLEADFGDANPPLGVAGMYVLLASLLPATAQPRYRAAAASAAALAFSFSYTPSTSSTIVALFIDW